MPTLDAVLDDAARLTAEGRLPVVVFDLDSTLFNTAARHLAILRDFAQAEPVVQPLVDELALSDFGWHVAEPLKARGLDDDSILERLNRFWYDRFFTDDYVIHDEPTAGAAEYARAVHKTGALVYYLTGRHVGGMEVGTAKSLTNHGFPFWSGRSVLHLKPDFHMADKPFKDQALRSIGSHRGDVIATFENEPGNANLFLGAYPEAHHFLVGRVRSPEGEAPDARLIEIPDFVPRD